VAPFSSVLGGAILGLDYQGWLEAPIGGGIAFTQGQVDENDLGHAKVDQVYAFLYETFVLSHCYADVALWGCYAQIRNVRNMGPVTARSHPTAWLLTPHVELGGDLSFSGWMMEPFAMLDWPNSWEKSFQEHGPGSENLEQKKQHASLLRTEAGLRFYESIEVESGRIVFLEKASYVNKKPFHVGTVTTSFLTGAPGLLTVDTLTSTQNLGVGEFAILFEPKKKTGSYASLSYQGEFGSTFQSHQGMVTLGKNW
jgi:outer membrane autotransporter protein